MKQLWHGFQMEKFEFEGKAARVVFPEADKRIGRLAVKTVYWDAFPEAVELDLLKRGFHLCCVDNDSRWGADADISRQSAFIRYVTKKYDLQKKAVPVGMSCGGLVAIKLAAKYPEIISCLYLDAPVINYLSCPACFGDAKPEEVGIDPNELFCALGMKGFSDLIAYRDMPLDKLDALICYKIPVFLVAGLADRVVPYHENGWLMQKKYECTDIDFACRLKPECDHHPHGLTDNSELIHFILTH